MFAAIAFLLVGGCADEFLTAAEGSQALVGPVELDSAKVLTRFGGPLEMLTTVRGAVRTGRFGGDEVVRIHYQVREANDVVRNWSAVDATELLPGIWEFETPVYSGFCPHYCPRHVYQFAIEYRSDGATYWDNNGGFGVDYVLANDIDSSVPVDYGPPAIMANPVELGYADWNPLAGRLAVQIWLQNLAYHKRVAFVYSTDAWRTVRELPARFMRMTGYGMEQWRLDVPLDPPGEDIRFAIRYEVGGRTYWDNHFRLDYTVPTP